MSLEKELGEEKEKMKMVLAKPYHTVKRQIKDSQTDLKQSGHFEENEMEEHTSHVDESRVKKVPKIRVVAKEDVEEIALRLKMHLLENRVPIEDLQQVN